MYMYMCVRGHVCVLEIMYICVRTIDFASFYNFSIGFVLTVWYFLFFNLLQCIREKNIILVLAHALVFDQ
jgi:hypothetical protein